LHYSIDYGAKIGQIALSCQPKKPLAKIIPLNPYVRLKNAYNILQHFYNISLFFSKRLFDTISKVERGFLRISFFSITIFRDRK